MGGKSEAATTKTSQVFQPALQKNENQTRGCMVEETRAASGLEDETRSRQPQQDESKISRWLGEGSLAAPGARPQVPKRPVKSIRCQESWKLEFESD